MRAWYQSVSRLTWLLSVPWPLLIPPLHLFSYSFYFHTTILLKLTVRADISFTSPPLHLSPSLLSASSVFWGRSELKIDVKQNKKEKNGCKWGSKTKAFNYREEGVNISAVELLSVSAIKKCFCIIGDFLLPSEHGGEKKVNFKLLRLAWRTN